MSWTVSNTVTEYYNPSEWTHLIGNFAPFYDTYNNSFMSNLYYIPSYLLQSFNITYFNNNQISTIPITSSTIINSWNGLTSIWFFNTYNNYFFMQNLSTNSTETILNFYTLNSIPSEITDSVLESATTFSYTLPTQINSYNIITMPQPFINGTNLYLLYIIDNVSSSNSTLYCLEITNFNTVSNTISTSYGVNTLIFCIDNNFNIYLGSQFENTYRFEQLTINFSSFAFNLPTLIYDFSNNNTINGAGIDNGVIEIINGSSIQNYIFNSSNSTIEIYTLLNAPISNNVATSNTYNISKKLVWELPSYLNLKYINQQNQYKVNYLPCYNFKYNKGRI